MAAGCCTSERGRVAFRARDRLRPACEDAERALAAVSLAGCGDRRGGAGAVPGPRPPCGFVAAGDPAAGGAWLRPGGDVVRCCVARISATAFCVSTGIHMLVLACQKAAANRTELRLLLPAPMSCGSCGSWAPTPCCRSIRALKKHCCPGRYLSDRPASFTLAPFLLLPCVYPQQARAPLRAPWSGPGPQSAGTWHQGVLGPVTRGETPAWPCGNRVAVHLPQLWDAPG